MGWDFLLQLLEPWAITLSRQACCVAVMGPIFLLTPRISSAPEAEMLAHELAEDAGWLQTQNEAGFISWELRLAAEPQICEQKLSVCCISH